MLPDVLWCLRLKCLVVHFCGNVPDVKYIIIGGLVFTILIGDPFLIHYPMTNLITIDAAFCYKSIISCAIYRLSQPLQHLFYHTEHIC